MEEIERYRHFNKYLKTIFGERTLKICIDGGFTCPNRDGKCGVGGCIFCSEKGSGEHIKGKDISSIVTNFLSSYRGKRANKFIAYFQNFTNTYAPIKVLKEKYGSAFVSDKIVALAVATRPDCIDENIAKLIKSYNEKVKVWVELGLQTANEETGKRINRCYTNKDFSYACKILNKFGIPVVCHIMIGLPGETHEDLENTVEFINRHKIWGIKIHSTYVVKNTALERLYNEKKYTPLSLEDYLKEASYVLSHISPEIVVQRISGDAPKELLVAPEWNAHKKWIMNGLDKYLKENNLYQGKYFKK